MSCRTSRWSWWMRHSSSLLVACYRLMLLINMHCARLRGALRHRCSRAMWRATQTSRMKLRHRFASCKNLKSMLELEKRKARLVKQLTTIPVLPRSFGI
ncbi:hypothetical protein GQ600_9512 [Phytophthora cactorum]|nr:hypothetical protein GQ600_9512 [Phytophthora cactorum]